MTQLKLIRMTKHARAAVTELGEPEFYPPLPCERPQAVVRWPNPSGGSWWAWKFDASVTGVAKRADGRWCWVLTALLLAGCAGTSDSIARKVADARNAYYAQCAGRPDDLECAMKRNAVNCYVDAYNDLIEEYAP